MARTIVSFLLTTLVSMAVSGAGAFNSSVLLLPSMEKRPTRPSSDAEMRNPEKMATATTFAA